MQPHTPRRIAHEHARIERAAVPMINRTCSARAIPLSIECYRPAMVAHLLQTERSCLGGLSSMPHDLYQFGVPSTMAVLSRTLVARRMASHISYWGFDSFTGLPEEAYGALRPSASMWRAGQFSQLYSAKRGARTVHNPDGSEQYILPEGSTMLTPEEARLDQLRDFKNPALRIRLVAGEWPTHT